LDGVLPRPRVAKIAGGLAAVSLVIFTLSLFFENVHFTVVLGASFALCFFACHWAAASYTRITLAQSRSIDYVYLGVASAGVFVLAMNYEEDRYEYRQNQYVDEAKVQLQKTKEHLDGALVRQQQTLCQLNIVSSMPEYCAQAKQLVLDYRAEDRAKDTADGSRAINLYMSNFHPPKDADETRKQLYRIVENELMMVRSMYLSVKTDIHHIEFQKPMPREPEAHPAWQIFTWPFILAFALALRLTRTTIEVLNWTHVATPVQSIPTPPPWVTPSSPP
jgi:hypothetical protein